jgi:TrmH family RNA methyltransferase
MINPNKFPQLEKGQKRRKLALCFGALERDILGIAEANCSYDIKSMSRTDYIRTLLQILLTDPGLTQDAKTQILNELNSVPFDERRACNIARNILLSLTGSFPAEWDLVIAPHDSERKRQFFPGLYVYAEDIRSPFNLGSIFRTAEALGAEKIYISPNCVSPDHPRAIRSGMGCIQNISWERKSLEELSDNYPVFLLETGGTPISQFKFPEKGICIIGSEELGVSPEAIKKAKYGCVTIPMYGVKASLNVGVAFGILMQAWISSIANK